MRVLIADDEKNIRETISKYFMLEKIDTILASNGISAKRYLEEESFDAAIIDLRMPGMSGLELLQWINSYGPSLPVIIISAYGDIKDAVDAMKFGAKDYIVKPFDPEELLLRLKRLVNEAMLQRRVESGMLKSSKFDLIGESSLIKKVKETILKVAATPSNVLIVGESGTGKEIVANLIHQSSDRVNGNFIPVNVAGIQENLLESELFGYEKGAFTGADSKKIGLFELASNGTLFLDEIGDMSLNLQVKLLRVIQEKRLMRLGGLVQVPIDTRLICATNKDLETLIKDKKFREDLYFRINVVKIELPPLRDRLEDIPLLVGHLIQKFNAIFKKNIKGITDDALKILEEYDYPGNVRELENIIERAFIYSDGDFLTNKEIDIHSNKSDRVKLGKLKEIERDLIIEALQKWDGNRTKAAEEIGVTRRTIHNKIKEYGIDI